MSLNVSIEIVGNGLCAVPENVRQTAGHDTPVVPSKVFGFYTNTSINRNLNDFVHCLTEQPIDGLKGVAVMLPLGQQLIQNFCIGPGGGVEQDYSTVVSSGQQLLEGIFCRGLSIVVPIHIGEAPKDRFVPQLLRLLQIFFTIDPLGRPIKFWQFFPCNCRKE